MMCNLKLHQWNCEPQTQHDVIEDIFIWKPNVIREVVLIIHRLFYQLNNVACCIYNTTVQH